MHNPGITEFIESELSAAIFNSDKEALKRFSIIVGEKLTKLEEVEKEQEETKSDIKMLIEVVKQGFEDVNKRFEDLYSYMDKRFEDMYRYMDKRFEAIDKRFEAIDKRFEDMNKKFEMMFKFMSLGFSVITILIVVFKFIH